MLKNKQNKNSHLSAQVGGAGSFRRNDLLSVLTLYKNRGETPLECLERFKKDNPEYRDEKMTYAGRLDPLAEGLLLVLVGEECKNKEKYLGLDKEYEVDILFGFSTDTYDILGKVTSCLCEVRKQKSLLLQDLEYSLIRKQKVYSSCKEGSDVATQVDESGLLHFVHNDMQSFVGRFSQKYPAFSSKTIRGKTLFSLFKSGELKDEEIPEKDVEIKDIKIIGERTMSKIDLEKYIKESIDLVKGDFRQAKILKKWKSVLDGTIRTNGSMEEIQEFSVISIRVNCTSGTYMRSLADSIGKKVGIPALALNIKRTKIDRFKI